jgi:hypothetical protein
MDDAPGKSGEHRQDDKHRSDKSYKKDNNDG